MKPATRFALLISFSFSILCQAQDIDAVERKLGEAVAEGDLSLEQAHAMLETLHEITEDDHQGHEKHHKKHHGKHEGVEEKIEMWVEKVGRRIEEAVEEGDLTEDEGWAKWKAFKKDELMPKLKASVKGGQVSKEWSREFMKGIEMVEVGEMLKAAVDKGEMTEDEAWRKWKDLYGDEDDEDEDDEDEDEDDEDEDDEDEDDEDEDDEDEDDD